MLSAIAKDTVVKKKDRDLGRPYRPLVTDLGEIEPLKVVSISVTCHH